ncbi:MAG: SixA phosphatase family protein [Vicinamibacterales bacterium]
MLFLVHHADAVDALVDPQRPLSEAGRQHAEQLASRAQARGVKPTVIWHSGKLRARQTAEPFWRLCNPLAEFAATRGLQPGDPPEWIRTVLESDPRDVMLVGHMPHIARLLHLLTEADASAPGFPAHGLVALERLDDRWMESWRQ